MFLQRHGECETNVKRLFTCRKLDPRLTDKGKMQINGKVPFYDKQNIQRIFSSPSQRALQTADILSSALDIKYEIDENLLEVDVGNIEGMSELEPKYLKLFFKIINDWVSNGKNICFPGGESKNDVERRLDHTITLLSSSTLLIGHAAFFALLLWKLKMPFINVKELFLPRGGTAHYFKEKRQWCIIKSTEP